MSILEALSLVIILTIIWNVIPDNTKASNVKHFIGLLPLIALSIPALPGMGLYYLLTEKLGMKKNGLPGLISSVSCFGFWFYLAGVWLKSSS